MAPRAARETGRPARAAGWGGRGEAGALGGAAGTVCGRPHSGQISTPGGMSAPHSRQALFALSLTADRPDTQKGQGQALPLLRKSELLEVLVLGVRSLGVGA